MMDWLGYDWERTPGQMGSWELIKDIFSGGPKQTMTREESTRELESLLAEYKRVANTLRARIHWALQYQKPLLAGWPTDRLAWKPSDAYISFKTQTEHAVEFVETLIKFIREHSPKGA